MATTDTRLGPEVDARRERLAGIAERLGSELGERYHDLVRLTDDDVVQAAYDLASRSDTEDNRTDADEDNRPDGDDWYFMLGEIFERFAPEAELRNLDRAYEHDTPDSAAFELAACRQSFYQREAARAAYRAARGETETARHGRGADAADSA